MHAACLRSAVGNISWLQICVWLQIQGRDLDPGPLTYFPGDWSWKIPTAILLPSPVSSYKRKYLHKVLVNRLVKLAQEKSVVKWSDRSDITIAVDWDVKHQTKQTNACTQTFEHHAYLQPW